VTTPADPKSVRWLLRCYPPAWRARYGEEFAAFLSADVAERPTNWRRTVNVIGSGMLARCTQAGLTSHQLPATEQARAGLATVGSALTVLAAFGMFVLAQLATGWQVAAAGSAPAAAGTLAMTSAAVLLAVTALAATVPVAWQVVRAAAGPAAAASVRRPAMVALGCAVAIVCGARHFENFWPGTSGLGVEHGLVPGGLAAFGWAATLSVSAYWAHPGLWGMFPAPEMAWMVLSPVAWLGLVAGVVTVVRRLTLPAGLLRYLARLAVAATTAAMVFLAGAATWVLAHGPGQSGQFRPGAIDVVSLLVMAVAAVIALRALSGIRRARLHVADAVKARPVRRG
jgi:hypothetical protein